jgi:hypothetical protein
MLRTVYRELIDALAEKGGVHPSDPSILADELALPANEIARCIPLLAELGRHGRGGVTLHDDGTLTIRRVTEDIDEEREYRKANQDNGRKGGLRSAQARLKRPSSRAKAPLNPPTPTPLPSGSPPAPLPSSSTPTPTTPDPEAARALSPEVLDGIEERSFEAFLRAYPERGVKSLHLVQQAWTQTTGFRPPVAELLDAIARQKRTDEWQRGVIPNAERWLLDRRWTAAAPPAEVRRDPALGPDFSAVQPTATRPRSGPGTTAGAFARQVLSVLASREPEQAEVEQAAAVCDMWAMHWPPTEAEHVKLEELANGTPAPHAG